MKTGYIPISQIKRESVTIIKSPYAHNNRAVNTSHGVFLIADNDHPTAQIGSRVCVIYDPEDQFASIAY